MSGNTNYCYTDAEDFVIENGIIKGMELPINMQSNNSGEIILDAFKANPEFCGIVDGLTGREETFAEMMEKSVKCAMWMEKNNIKSGDIICICTHNQPDMYVPCFASLFIGAVINPWWETGLTKEMARYFFSIAKPKMFFVHEVSANIIIEVAKEMGIEIEKVVVFGKQPNLVSLDEILASQDSKLVSEYRCTKLSSVDEPAAILYTSGTTNTPKGALYSHKCIFGAINIISKYDNWAGCWTTLALASISWCTGFVMMLRGVTARERRIIYPEFEEDTLLKLVEKFKVNWLLLGVNAASRIRKSPALFKYDLESLMFLSVTGEIMTEELQKSLAASFPNTLIIQAFGATEIGVVALQQLVDVKPGSCGTILENVTIKVVDPESGRILGPNETGEIFVKTPYMMTCYYNDPELTKKVIDSEGWFSTGDLVHYDEEGHIFIRGKRTDLIRYRDEDVPSAMVERVLQSHPEIKEAAVVSIPHDIDGSHPVAFVVKTPDSKVTKEEIQKLVSDTLPDYMALRGGVQFLDELPRTTSDKVATKKLKDLAISCTR